MIIDEHVLLEVVWKQSSHLQGTRSSSSDLTGNAINATRPEHPRRRPKGLSNGPLLARLHYGYFSAPFVAWKRANLSSNSFLRSGVDSMTSVLFHTNTTTTNLPGESSFADACTAGH